MRSRSALTCALVASVLALAAGVTRAEGQAARDIAGSWTGTLSVGGASLRVVFHVERDSTGKLAAKMDSPDQGAYGIPVSETVVAGDSVRFRVAAIAGEFSGTISADASQIAGHWRQSGAAFPLVLERGAPQPPQRPQEPVPPLPYQVEEVRFPNVEAGIELAGTLTRPASPGPHPAVVLISGSGPQDRDETVFGHRPFLVLADHLTRKGIAVLRYDDRGVGGSTGHFAAATSADFAADALAAVAWLKARPEIDPTRIGLIGHSEGGLIAAMAAARSRDVAFIVLLAAPGVNGEEILRLQSEKILRASGVADELIRRNQERQRRLFAIVKNHQNSAAAALLRAELRAQFDTMSEAEKQALGVAGSDPDTAIALQARQLNSPWFRFFLAYEPAASLERVTVPVLALMGENDLQVPPEQNAPALRAALERAGNRDATVRVLPGLNHLFQPSRTGAPAEYGTIEITMADEALGAISSWILERFGPQRDGLR